MYTFETRVHNKNIVLIFSVSLVAIAWFLLTVITLYFTYTIRLREVASDTHFRYIIEGVGNIYNRENIKREDSGYHGEIPEEHLVNNGYDDNE